MVKENNMCMLKHRASALDYWHPLVVIPDAMRSQCMFPKEIIWTKRRVSGT